MPRVKKTIQDVLDRMPRPAARWSRLFGLGIIVGVLGGGAAAALERGLHYGTHELVGRIATLAGAAKPAFHFDWRLVALPMAGCLLSGIVIRLFCPRALGIHGTDSLTRAFHRQMGDLPLRAPIIKGAAAIGVISSGGSAGPEGPIAALGAALGSVVGRIFKATPQERRVLLIAGCAAGVGAIFQCPLGGALFATSLLYSEEEFEGAAIVPSFVASVIGYTVFVSINDGFDKVGVGTLLRGTDKLAFSSAYELIPYVMLAVLCSAGAILFSVGLKTVEERVVPRSPIPRWMLPGIGGLLTGLIACALPQVMDGQYTFIQSAIEGVFHHGDDQVSMLQIGFGPLAGLFLAVAISKCIATALTVGSGSAGGVLGPSVFIGGAIGAFLGAIVEAWFPGVFSEDLRRALIPVGMGGVLAVTMRTPLAAIVMIMEMTGSYGLIVPLMLVCMTAYVIGRRWGLNHEQVRTPAESPAHAGDAIVHMLESWHVRDLMEPKWEDTVAPETTLPEMVERIRPGTRPVFAVAKGDDLLGVVSVPDIRSFMEDPALANFVIAADMMTVDLRTVDEDTEVYLALDLFRRSEHQVLPVLSHNRPHRWIGMLSRERVFEAIRESMAETQQAMLEEHAGLTAIEQEGQLHNLVMGVTPTSRDMIQRLIVPMDALGKSLREADFRRHYNAQVIAIEQPDGSVQCPPDIDSPLRSGQRLLAIVWHDVEPAPVARTAAD
ncbi:MAG: chloride channel protein [Phycisphaerales bacterium]|nr:chloride channel protein [Phycisphaerales bacterium]MCB9863797.1 chloride channel protein [Phycisphaerales bacterium]